MGLVGVHNTMEAKWTCYRCLCRVHQVAISLRHLQDPYLPFPLLTGHLQTEDQSLRRLQAWQVLCFVNIFDSLQDLLNAFCRWR